MGYLTRDGRSVPEGHTGATAAAAAQGPLSAFQQLPHPGWCEMCWKFRSRGSECHGLNRLILNLDQWQGPRQFRIGLFAYWTALNCGSFLTWLGQSIWKFKPEIIHYHRVSIRGLKSKLSWITLSSPRFTKDEKDWVLLGLENEQMPKWLIQRAFQN